MMIYSQEKKVVLLHWLKCHLLTLQLSQNLNILRFFCSKANLSLVPTPSVLLNKIGSLYLSFFKSKIEQNPPGFKITFFSKVFFCYSFQFFD